MRPLNTPIGWKRVSGVNIQAEEIHKTEDRQLRKRGPRGGDRQEDQAQGLMLSRRKKILPLRRVRQVRAEMN